MIKIFPFGRLLAGSIFLKEEEAKESQSLLREYDIALTANEDAADLIMTNGLQSKRIIAKLLEFMFKYGRTKKYLIWADEPRFDNHFSPIANYPFLPPLHIFNTYTGVYINNYRFLQTFNLEFQQISPCQLETLKDFEFKHRKTVAVMLYRNNQREWSLKYQSRELDLCYLRTQIALTGYKLGVCDIYGHGWPNGISLGKSRWQDRVNNKRKILENYHFNLAFENTNWPYYCTEKIWEAIQFGCLPIYYGQENAIYEDFCQGSFIDYSEFENTSDMFRFIEAMTPQDYRRRMNLCIEAFNAAILKREKVGGGWKELVRLTAQRIHEIFSK